NTLAVPFVDGVVRLHDMENCSGYCWGIYIRSGRKNVSFSSHRKVHISVPMRCVSAWSSIEFPIIVVWVEDVSNLNKMILWGDSRNCRNGQLTVKTSNRFRRKALPCLVETARLHEERLPRIAQDFLSLPVE